MKPKILRILNDFLVKEKKCKNYMIAVAYYDDDGLQFLFDDKDLPVTHSLGLLDYFGHILKCKYSESKKEDGEGRGIV